MTEAYLEHLMYDEQKPLTTFAKKHCITDVWQGYGWTTIGVYQDIKIRLTYFHSDLHSSITKLETTYFLS